MCVADKQYLINVVNYTNLDKISQDIFMQIVKCRGEWC
jgi:hypothetical protein